MKKLIFILLSAVLISTLIFGSCAKETPTPHRHQHQRQHRHQHRPRLRHQHRHRLPRQLHRASTGTSPHLEGVYGGTLRIIYASAPRVLGGSVEQGPFDLYVLLAGVEKIMEYNDKQVLAPWLAESAVNDDKTQTITIKLRPGHQVP